MAKLFLDHQFCEDNAETIEGPVSSYMDARAIQKLGNISFTFFLRYILMLVVAVGCAKTSSSSKSSTITTSCSEVDQEPSTVLRS